MRILIFEGIATSGKSTMIDELKKALPATDMRVFGETATHIPIMQQTKNKQINFFKKLVNQAIAGGGELIVFDRLYLTQAFRAKAKITEYSEVEELLRPHQPMTIFLKVKESKIADRIEAATQHRDAQWGDHVNSKGQTKQAIAKYYLQQQRHQLELLERSRLPYQVLDTTNGDYPSLVQAITNLPPKE